MTDTQHERQKASQPTPILTKDDAVAGAQAALDKKALDVVLLEVAPVVMYADYILICSGRSTVQVNAIAAEIEAQMKLRKIRPLHIEGLTEARWILMDYDELIIHIFVEDARSFYNLERLWGDVSRTAFESPTASALTI